MGTWIVAVIVMLGVVWAVYSMIRSKKPGKSLTCGGNCSVCAGNCSGCSPKEEEKMGK